MIIGKRLQNEELHSLQYSHNIVRVIKSKRLRWKRHVVSMEESRGVFKILRDKPIERRPLGRLKHR